MELLISCVMFPLCLKWLLLCKRFLTIRRYRLPVSSSPFCLLNLKVVGAITFGTLICFSETIYFVVSKPFFYSAYMPPGYKPIQNPLWSYIRPLGFNMGFYSFWFNLHHANGCSLNSSTMCTRQFIFELQYFLLS